MAVHDERHGFEEGPDNGQINDKGEYLVCNPAVASCLVPADQQDCKQHSTCSIRYQNLLHIHGIPPKS